MAEAETSVESCKLSASEAFIQSLCGVINEHDVKSLIDGQKLMLTRYEKTNEMLINCNALSSSRLQVATQEFRRYTMLLTEMRKDLQSISKRIKKLKTRLSAQYPHAFQVCSEPVVYLSDDEDPNTLVERVVDTGVTEACENPPVPGNSPSSSCTQPPSPNPEIGSSSSTES